LTRCKILDFFSILDAILPMSHREFLEKFGPAKNAADAFGVSTISIGHWKIRGIPSFYWAKALQLAIRNDWELTPEELMTTSPSKRIQSVKPRISAENEQI
jgi:hypothetical protein